MTNSKLKPSEVMVVMGNTFDTNGADIAAATLISVDPERHPTQMMYFLATPKGIALATFEVEGYYSTTHCMPLDYADWIRTHWNIEISDEIRNKIAEASFLSSKLETEEDLEQAILNLKQS